MTSPILVVEHEAQCPPARLGDWLRAAGTELEVCRPYAGDRLPSLRPSTGTSYAGLLVLGGSASANDDSIEYFEPLREMVRDAAAAGVPTLGVCLGHQVIARALGGAVEVNPQGQQVGVLTAGWTDAAETDVLFGPSRPARAIQWNHDVVVGLPEGAEVLAATPDGETQVVRFAPTVWGVQAHPEATLAICTQWAAEDRDEHELRGLDQRRFLTEVGEAEDSLGREWEPVARRFAALVLEGA